MTKRDWYKITNKADDEQSADVYIYDEIGGWFGVDAQQFVTDFAALDAATINLYVNSPGGSIFDGIAILNAIRRHPANIVAHVDGLAASAASFLIMGADEIVMGRNSQMMIHDGSGVCLGTAKDMDDTARLLNKLSNTIAEVYAERTGTESADWRQAMLAETWYTADEATAAGLADRVDGRDTTSPENRFDLSGFHYQGRANAPAPLIPQNSQPRGWERADKLIASAYAAVAAFKPPTESEASTPTPTSEKETDVSQKLTEGLRNRLGVTAELSEDELLAALDEALTEQAETAPSNTLPEGTVAIDSKQLEQLQADAQAGREAAAKHEAEARAEIVDKAVQEGRIAPANRDMWVARLEADPGNADIIATLQPVVNLEAKGYTGGIDESSDTDEKLFTKAWGSQDNIKED